MQPEHGRQENINKTSCFGLGVDVGVGVQPCDFIYKDGWQPWDKCRQGADKSQEGHAYNRYMCKVSTCLIYNCQLPPANCQLPKSQP